MDDNTDIVDRLRSMYYELSRRQASTPFGERSELDGIPALLYEAAIKIQDLQGNEIERLRQERDQARRMFCVHASGAGKIYFTGKTPQQIADYFNWYDSPQEEKQHDVEE